MKYKISYSEVITDEELKEMTDSGSLEDYLWECVRPEGDEWEVEEIDE